MTRYEEMLSEMTPTQRNGLTLSQLGYKRRNASLLGDEKTEIFIVEIKKGENRSLKYWCLKVRNKLGLAIYIDGNFPNKETEIGLLSISIPYNSVFDPKLRAAVIEELKTLFV